MADKKISQLTTLAQADVAVTADFLPIVDTSATETKKATPQALVQAGATGATLPVALGAVTTPSYTFTGDLNTGLWSPAADTVAVSTNGVERMRLDSSGNLGIGVTPSAVSAGDKVVQVGSFLFNNNTNGYGILRYNNFYNGTNDVYYANGTASAFQMQGNAFKWYQAASGTAGNAITFTQAMTLDSSGNLGIGTASPSQRLHVNGSTIVPIANSYFTFDVRFGIGTPDSSGLQIFTGDEIRFGSRTLGGVFTDRMKLDVNGNLGIGTASPSVKLEVNGQIRTEAPTGGTAANWRLGTVHTVSPTSPNRTIEVDIGGTIYYLHAKTTNN